MSKILELYADFIGAVVYSASPNAPSGFLDCNGQTVSRTTYAALFAKIGTTWGAGDGSTTFTLPDLRGRVPVASGQGTGLTNRALAATGGAETHQLTIPEMPAHTHTLPVAYSNSNSGMYYEDANTNNPDTNQQTTGSTGGNQAHNNMQPFAVLRAFIKF